MDQDEERCKHGIPVDAFRKCQDCADPRPLNALSSDERLRRWLDWCDAVMEPSGTGAVDWDMREGMWRELQAAVRR